MTHRRARDHAPAADERLALALEHFRESLIFYGDHLGLRIFRKHLAAYVQQAPWPSDSEERRTARQELCRMDLPGDVERGLTRLWTVATDREEA